MGNPLTIIAIDPGTKAIGLAVFKDFDLRYWGTKTIRRACKGRDAAGKTLEKILLPLIDRYSPRVLIIQSPHYPQQKKSRCLKEIISKTKLLAEKKKIKIIDFSRVEIRQALYKTGRPTKMKVAKTICEEYYPFLSRVYEKDLNKHWWQEKYYTKMFSAISLGIYYLNKSNHVPK